MNRTPAEHAEILRSYLNEGKRIRDFRADYNLLAPYVSAIIQRFNVSHKKSYTFTISESKVRKWIELYNEGVSLAKIAKAFNSSTSTVSAYLRAYEVHEPQSLSVNDGFTFNPKVYRRAAIEAADYWKDRCEKHYKFWQDEAQAHSI